jgi:hypothetical protein
VLPSNAYDLSLDILTLDADPALAALIRVRSYLRSVGKFGSSAFLLGQYGGAGEIAQGFCRFVFCLVIFLVLQPEDLTEPVPSLDSRPFKGPSTSSPIPSRPSPSFPRSTMINQIPIRSLSKSKGSPSPSLPPISSLLQTTYHHQFRVFCHRHLHLQQRHKHFALPKPSSSCLPTPPSSPRQRLHRLQTRTRRNPPRLHLPILRFSSSRPAASSKSTIRRSRRS